MSAKRFELFEFVIMLHPTEEEWEKGEKTTRVDPDGEDHLLAPDLETARLMAASRIPKNIHDKIDRVEVAVRPFLRAHGRTMMGEEIEVRYGEPLPSDRPFPQFPNWNSPPCTIVPLGSTGVLYG